MYLRHTAGVVHSMGSRRVKVEVGEQVMCSKDQQAGRQAQTDRRRLTGPIGAANINKECIRPSIVHQPT